MGEADRFQDYRRTTRRFNFLTEGNSVLILFAINFIFFLLLLTVQVAFYFYRETPESFYNTIIRWFELPAHITTFSERPWTILTFMFSEAGNNLIRLLTNMVWLWAFGYILQEMTGNDKIIPIYIYGGLLGGLVFLLSGSFLPSTASMSAPGLLGANTSILAVAMATTTLAPKTKFFRQIRGGIPIWVLMVAYMIIDYAGVSALPAAYALAHLGGAAAGFLFVVLLRKGKDGSIWMNRLYNGFMNLFNPDKKKRAAATRERLYYQTGKRTPYKKTSNVTQQRVDEILDKINQKGYHFLSDEEKDILKKASEGDL